MMCKFSFRRCFYLILTVNVSIFLFNDIAFSEASPWKGAGTESDPWQISDPNGLESMMNNTSYYSDRFILTSDIDLKGREYFNPLIAQRIKPLIGLKLHKSVGFSGVFDGKNHTIKNLKITSKQKKIGLFGQVLSNAIIKNLNVEQISITRLEELVLFESLEERQVRVCTGGLIAHNKGRVINCTTNVSITGTNWDGCVGGLVGYNDEGRIEQCHSNCNVKRCQSGIGGLVGGSTDGLITDCSAEGVIIGTKRSSGLGGLVGGITGGKVERSHAETSVVGGEESHWLGGLIGTNTIGVVQNCFASGSVSGEHTIGGLVGFNVGQIVRCYASGEIKGHGSLGGLVGTNGSDASFTRPLIPCFIKECYAVGAVIGSKKTVSPGGLVGSNWKGDIRNSFWDVKICGTDLGVGWKRKGDVENLLGKTTEEMQMKSTFIELPVCWDFDGESENGTEGIWCMPQERCGYPILTWQLKKVDKL